MTAITALLGFAAWTLLLVLAVFAYRGIRILGGTPINAWPRGAKPASDAPLVKRIEDAHANSLENLLVFAVIVLSAQALGRAEAIAPLAAIVLYARLGQGVTHLIGTSQPLVLLRAVFWAVQLALFFWMLWSLFA